MPTHLLVITLRRCSIFRVRMRLSIRDARQFLIAPCLFYVAVQQKYATFTHIIIFIAHRMLRIGKRNTEVTKNFLKSR